MNALDAFTGKTKDVGQQVFVISPTMQFQRWMLSVIFSKAIFSSYFF